MDNVQTGIVLPEWRTLGNSLLNEPIGKVFSHDVLANVVNLIPRSNKYYTTVIKTIKYLTSFGIRLSNVKGVGYKILSPDEWVTEIKSRIRRGESHFTEAQYILNHAPITLMSAEVKEQCLQLHDAIIKRKFVLAGGVTSYLDTGKNINLELREGNKL